jgi:hypothetical protein
VSTNPGTKAYWRRVKRIGAKISFSAEFESDPIKLYEFARDIDPKATNRMIEDALESALEDQRRFAEIYERHRSRAAHAARHLDDLLAQTRRAQWQVIKGNEP